VRRLRPRLLHGVHRFQSLEEGGLVHGPGGMMNGSRRPEGRECLEQRGDVVATKVEDAVDEQGRRTLNLAWRRPALDVSIHAVPDGGAGTIVFELRDVEFELEGVESESMVSERFLATNEPLVHVPEPPLQGRGFGRARRPDGVWVDLCK
jgi:hypothetical protein